MTPTEKAKELVFKFLHMGNVKKAKEHALICTEEMLNLLDINYSDCSDLDCDYNTMLNTRFWEKVKTEIEKL